MENCLSAMRRIHEHSAFNLVLGVLLVLTGVLLSDIPTMISSLTWPDVPGVITSRKLIGQKFQEYDGDYYLRINGYLKYHYTVDGTSYSGFAVDALEEISCPEDTARSYPVGREVEVYYNPRDPSQAVLEPGLVISGKAFGLLSSLCCWVGFYFLALGLWRRLTGRRFLLRGWPQGDKSGEGIGIGSGKY